MGARHGCRNESQEIRDGKEFSSIIENPEEGFQRAIKLVSGAKECVWISTTASGLEKLMEFYPFGRLKGKVDIKILCPVTNDNIGAVRGAMSFADIRHIPEATLRATIVDDRETLVVIKRPGEAPKGSVYSSDKSVVTSVKSFFTSLWENAIDANIAIEKIVSSR